MQRIRTLSGVAAAALTLIAVAIASAEPPQDREKIRFDPAPAVDAVRRTIEAAGGDPERDAVHLILGFSTGNLARDPIAANAMRQVAQQLLNRFLVAGDTVTVFGFEKDVWTGLEPWSRPFDPAGREESWQRWPRSPAPDSVGGSDYNRALVRVLQKVADRGDPAAYVAVLLGTHPLVQEPRRGGSDTLSDESPELQGALRKAGATSLKTQEPFTFTQTRGDATPRSIWMHIATPRRFAAPEVEGDSRSNLVAKGSWCPPDDPYIPPEWIPLRAYEPDHRPPAPIGPILALVAVAAVGVVLWKAGVLPPKSPRRPTLTMGADGKPVSEWKGPFGKSLLGRVVGAGFAESELQPCDVPVGRAGQTPPRVLLEIHGDGRGVRLVPVAAELAVDGVQSPGGTVIVSGRARKATLKGQNRITPGGPAIPFTVQLEFKIA